MSIGQSGASAHRQTKARKIIECLTARYDHVLLQEIKSASDRALVQALRFYFPDISFASSSLNQRHGGVAILTSPNITRNYNLEVFPPPPGSPIVGRAVTVHVSPKNGTAGIPYGVTCCYFSDSSAATIAERVLQVKALERLPFLPCHIVGGDFNFVSKESDRRSNYVDSPRLLGAWDALRASKGLEEVYQPVHTYYGVGNAGTVSSRIDRFYLAGDLVHTLNFDIEAAIVPRVPYTLSSLPPSSPNDSWYIKDYAKSEAIITDHLPVGIRFIMRDRGNSAFSIPKAVLDDPSFPTEVNAVYNSCVGEEDSGFARLASLRHSIRLVTKSISHAKDKTRDSLRDAAAALAEACSPNHSASSIIAAAKGNLEVLALFDWENSDDSALFTTPVRNYIDTMIDSQSNSSDHPAVENARSISRVERLSSILPSSRRRISHLLDEDAISTDDPVKMTGIAYNFWGKRWVFQHTKIDPDRYLRDYQKRITKPILVPTIELIEQVILDMGDSSPGPDGVPFSAYKRSLLTSAPVFLQAVQDLLDGLTPPPGFNGGLLYLLPKKGLGTIEDTRPIVVSNTENRIIATVFNRMIIDALSDIIDPDQKGFIPGRLMKDHLLHFNESFYKALEENSPYDLLLYDFEKAFDSCSHSMILHLLRHVGLPENVVTAISLFFHQAHALTTFRGAPPARIDFLRGIKQGCPLSPLLFVLLMDVLMYQLKKVDGLEARMFADDTGTGATHLGANSLYQIKCIFDDFKDATGLALNLDKTYFLTTRPNSEHRIVRARLRVVGWSDIKISGGSQYLGCPLGGEVDFGEAFYPRLSKFEERIRGYAVTNSSLSATSKILVANVFLLPLLYFPAQFLRCPSCYAADIRKNLMNWMAHFRAIPLIQYCRPREFMGWPRPLIHFKLWNLALLTQSANELPVDPSYDRVKAYQTCTMRFSHHHFFALSDCLERGLSESDFRDKSPGQIYNSLLHTKHYTDTFLGFVESKLDRWNMSVEDKANAIVNYPRLPKWIPDHAVEFVLNLLHNALATAMRMAKFGRGAGNTRLPPHTPCFLCLLPRSDCANHLFRVCPVARSAVATVFYHLGMDPVAIQGGLHRPIFGAAALPPEHHATVILAGDAIWRLRSHLSDGLVVRNVSDWVLSAVLSALGAFAPSSHINHFPSHNLPSATVDALRGKSCGFGAAGTRSTEQAEAARDYCARIVGSLDAADVQLWTDGSAIPNPGPAGAGALIIFSDGTSIEASSALGNGTNNLGELWAVGSGLERLVAHPSFGSHSRIHVFTDSEYARGILAKGWRASDYSYLATAIRKLIREHSLSIKFHKVAAHVGIPGNERADKLAAKGAEVSMSLGYSPDLKCILSDYGFVGLDC